ncbi:MAG: PaaI family thioesterase [Erysipelotrichaceae bacterium]|nr:PaaI family thioesterase [Erysipelotrichaceae bacterium]
MSTEIKLKPVTAFDNYEIITYEPGKTVIKSIVGENALNPYGMIHGGCLYTLCDYTAGITAYSLGSVSVTLQSNINYIKPSYKDDVLYIESICIHNGKSTKVIETKITNDKQEIICSASFTMYHMKAV